MTAKKITSICTETKEITADTRITAPDKARYLTD